jgi:glycosyltransferase involved in cell wall biosynthesis
MRILLGYSHYPYSGFSIADWNEGWLARMREAGFQVEGTCLTLDPPGPRLAWPELDRLWKAGDRRLMAHYEALARRLEGFDALVNYNGINLHPRFVEQLPVFTVYSCCDDPESSEGLSKPVAAAYDLCLAGNIAAVDAYRGWGARNVRFWPLGFRREDYDPRLTRAQILERPRGTELTLLCERTSPWRRERLDRFASAFPGGVFRGPGWPLGFLPEAERVPLLQDTKVGVNFHNSTGPINFRTYYLPANGVLQVCDNRSFLAHLFDLGREAVGFDTVPQAVDACRYYLAHEDERLELAVAGWERAQRDYSETAVFQKLVDAIREHQPVKGATAPGPGVASHPEARILLHEDNLYQPDQWWRRFDYLLREVYRIPCQHVDLLAPGVLAQLSEVRAGDGLIGRFGHLPQDLALIRPIYPQLDRLFGGRLFPREISYRFYDDKRAQMELFRRKGYAMPLSAWVASEDELRRFMRGACLDFPLVMKASGGAGSSTVSLVERLERVAYPCLVQEFCRGNEGDLRINVIGHRVMGFHRLNRDDDFRASGSGRLVYSQELDAEAVQMAYRISRENGFDSMAYDFVKRGDRWVVLEMSYCYVDAAVRDCAYYYDMRTGEKVDKRGVYPQDFILEDFLREHYPDRLPQRSVPRPEAAPARRPRLLLVADVPAWIFDRHAHVLQARLGDTFEIDIAYQGQPIDEARYDLIHPLEWNLVPLDQIRTPAKWVTGIRSHISWDRLDFQAFCRVLREKFGAVYVVSRRLLEIFEPHVPGVHLLSHGVDAAFFRPGVKPSLDHGRLRLGWAGNRKSPAKGFEAYIAPLGELPGVELVFCGYSDRLLTQAEMRDFYASIDCYVCSSSTEGHNNALLEAAAMERAIITTDVGTVPDYLVDGESALIVPREAEAFRQAVLRLRDDADLRLRLGLRARQAVLARFDWNQRLEAHRAFFLEVLRNHGLEREEPAREALVFEPDWSTAGWAEVVLSFVQAFQPGEPVALVLPLRPGGPSLEQVQVQVLTLIQRSGRTEFPDLVLAEPGELEDVLRGVRRFQAIPDRLGQGRDPDGSFGARFNQARRQLTQRPEPAPQDQP